MLPAIGSVSALAGLGRVGVVVGAQPVGEPENGRQLVSLRIREGERQRDERLEGNSHSSATADLARGSASAGRDAREPGLQPAAASMPASARLPTELSPPEKAAVTRLQQRDQQVRQEEEAHAAVAGDLAGPISYVYQRGPDGRQYAVGGSVSLRATMLSGDPEQAKRLGTRMAAAANAATNPSAQDYAAARQAYTLGSQLGISPQPDERVQGLNMTL